MLENNFDHRTVLVGRCKVIMLIIVNFSEIYLHITMIMDKNRKDRGGALSSENYFEIDDQPKIVL